MAENGTKEEAVMQLKFQCPHCEEEMVVERKRKEEGSLLTSYCGECEQDYAFRFLTITKIRTYKIEEAKDE